MRRWLVALAALMIGGAVSGTLMVVDNPARDTSEVYVAARDVQAGSPLASDVIALERVKVASSRTLLFARGDESRLATLQATHDLVSGQLIQRSDVTATATVADRRLVFVPVKDAPPAPPGARLDLLVVAGTPDHVYVAPFALGVEVRSSVAGGFVVVVPSKQAAAFVYAAGVMHLVAVIAEPGTASGVEEAVSSPDQAMAMAAQR